MRKVSKFSQGRGSSDVFPSLSTPPREIPRVVHQLYVLDTPPRWQFPLLATWRELRPEWEYRFWTEDDLTGFQNQDLIDNASTHAPGHEGQFIADVARYEILRDHGGVWADTDCQLLRPIDDLCGVDTWLAWEDTGRWVGNAIIGSVRGHHLWDAAVNLLPANVERYAGRAVTKLSGPQFLTPIVQRHGATIYPREWFYPFSYKDIDDYPVGTDVTAEFPEARVAHWWANRRRRQAASV